jgi:hypothetical protein
VSTNNGPSIPKEERPSYIIAADFELFAHLYSALRIETNEVQSKVWELLCSIPTSIDIYNKIKDISALNTTENQKTLGWDDLFPKTNPFGRLYALQIVDQLVSFFFVPKTYVITTF